MNIFFAQEDPAIIPEVNIISSQEDPAIIPEVNIFCTKEDPAIIPADKNAKQEIPANFSDADFNP